MTFKLVYYSQQDAQWRNDILGFGDPGDTIGHVGCALTSVAMLVSGHGYIETPKSLNQKLRNVNGFVSAAIRWGSVSQVCPQVGFKSFIPCAGSAAPLAQIDASIAAGQPAIVQVDSSPAQGIQTHWVVLYARKGGDYLMLDPWPYQTDVTKQTPLMPRYAQGKTLERAISHVILYECYTSGGDIVIPDGETVTPGAVHARVKSDVTWGLNIRSSVNTSSPSNILVVVPAGTILTLLETDGAAKIGAVNQWIRVREPGGREGFAAAWYLEKIPAGGTVPSTETVPGSETETLASTPAAEPQKLIVRVKSSGAKIHKTASATSAVVSKEKSGARLVVVEKAGKALEKIGVDGKWLNVKGTNGRRGYVNGGLVKKG